MLLIKYIPEDDDDEIDAVQFFVWNSTKDIALKTKQKLELPRDLAAKFSKLVPLIRENSTRSFEELNGGCKCDDFVIMLKSDVTIFKYPYKRSELESDILRKGIIRISDSPYSSQFFTVNKKDKTPRPVIDNRELIDWPI